MSTALVLAGCANTSSEEDWTVEEPTTTSPSDQGAATQDADGDSSTQTPGEDPGAVTPTARGEIGRLRVAVPDDWTETLEPDQLFNLRYVEGDGEDAPTLSLAGDFGPYDTARVGLNTLIAEVQIGTPGFSVQETTDIEVPGADSAVRLDFVYGTEEEGGTFEGMWIVASDAQEKESVAVTLSAPTLEDSLRQDVQDSMTMLEP